MPTDLTPFHKFPSPDLNEPPNGPAQIKALADAVEKRVGMAGWPHLQPGVFDQESWAVVPDSPASMTVSVKSDVGGWAVVEEVDATFYVPRLAFVGPTVATTDVVLDAAHATLPRVDRIVVSSAGVISFVKGTPTAAATLDNLNGAASVPDGTLLLADVLVAAAAASVAAFQIRDRRSWARGAYYVLTSDTLYTLPSNAGSFPIDDTNFLPRIETRTGLVRMTLLGQVKQSTAGAIVQFYPRYDDTTWAGGNSHTISTANGWKGGVLHSIISTPFPIPPGSHRFGYDWSTTVATTTLSIGAQLIIEEILRPNLKNNTLTSG